VTPPGEGLRVEFGGIPMELLPDRALLLPRSRALLVADLHLGKAAAFRSHGIPVPDGDTEADLARLSALLQATGARRLLILGDLLHARRGRSPELDRALTEWRERHPALEVSLIRGNHDVGAGDPPAGAGIEAHTAPLPVEEGELLLLHEPVPDPRTRGGPYRLAGHLHPGIRLGSALRGARGRAPCFWFSPGQGVLPAFGSFTGLHPVTPGREDRIFLAGDGAPVELPAATLRASGFSR